MKRACSTFSCSTLTSLAAPARPSGEKLINLWERGQRVNYHAVLARDTPGSSAVLTRCDVLELDISEKCIPLVQIDK